jgi:hypothetical protein
MIGWLGHEGGAVGSVGPWQASPADRPTDLSDTLSLNIYRTVVIIDDSFECVNLTARQQRRKTCLICFFSGEVGPTTDRWHSTWN